MYKREMNPLMQSTFSAKHLDKKGEEKKFCYPQCFLSPSRLPTPKTVPRTRADNKRNFPLIRPRLQSYKKGPYYRGAQLWNNLSAEQQFSIDKSSFKPKIKKLLGTNLKGKRSELLNLRRNKKFKGSSRAKLYYDIFPKKKSKTKTAKPL